MTDFSRNISFKLAVGSWQLVVGSWQLAVGSWQLAVSSFLLGVGSFQLSTPCLVLTQTHAEGTSARFESLNETLLSGNRSLREGYANGAMRGQRTWREPKRARVVEQNACARDISVILVTTANCQLPTPNF